MTRYTTLAVGLACVLAAGCARREFPEDRAYNECFRKELGPAWAQTWAAGIPDQRVYRGHPQVRPPGPLPYDRHAGRGARSRSAGPRREPASALVCERGSIRGWG